MRLVRVDWVDSYGVSPSWRDIGDESLHGTRPLICYSVGWLAYESEDVIVVVPHLSPESDRTEQQGCGDMTIPRISIKRIVDLREEG